jgi:hypothetical protein
MIGEHGFLECESLASVACDPGSKLRPTLSALLIEAPLIHRRCSCA